MCISTFCGLCDNKYDNDNDNDNVKMNMMHLGIGWCFLCDNEYDAFRDRLVLAPDCGLGMLPLPTIR